MPRFLSLAARWLPIVLAAAEAHAGAIMETGVLAASEADQAAAADDRYVYAIASTAIAQYDRATGRRLALSHGSAHHLNSGAWWQGKLFCAHSNFPHLPSQSEVMVLDPATMELTVFKDLGAGHGSLTWVVRDGDSWWCTFAVYGANNAQTCLVQYDADWKEQGRWTYPPEVIARLGQMSISGGLWSGGTLLATGHDRTEVYRLQLPAQGSVLKLVETLPSPFPGQGLSLDGRSPGLVGIGRAHHEVIFATLPP